MLGEAGMGSLGNVLLDSDRRPHRSLEPQDMLAGQFFRSISLTVSNGAQQFHVLADVLVDGRQLRSRNRQKIRVARLS